MSSNIEIDDDYVTRLLVEDARKTSQKYSRQGSSSLLPDRHSGVPKPNTRFLSNIVRQADQHNATLKRKEEAESELRLRELNQHNHPPKRRRIDEDISHRRSRLFKDVADAAHSTSRSKEHKRSSPKKSKEEHKRHARHRRSNSRSDRDEQELHERQRRPKRSNSPTKRSVHSSTSKVFRPEKAEHHINSRHHEEDRRSDGCELSPGSSDLLEEVTGPLFFRAKYPRSRGRGTKRPGSNIDGHFSPNYNPDQDASINSDEDGDDWDMALEALRDRAKWKKNQSARLLNAGFSEQEISRSNNRPLDKEQRSLDEQIDAIRWSRKGETREWDADKVLE